jgi:hypothetical protein
MKSYFVGPLLAMALCTAACGGGGGAEDGPPPKDKSTKTLPVEVSNDQITIGGKRYYNACRVALGHGLAGALSTKYTASVEVQEIFAEAGGNAVVKDGRSVLSACNLSNMGRGDITAQFEVRRWPKAADADLVQRRLSAGGEPLGSVAKATSKVNESAQQVNYVGLIDETTTIQVNVLANLDDSKTKVALGSVRQQTDPVIEEVLAQADNAESQADALSGGDYGEAKLLDPCAMLDATAAKEVFARDQELKSSEAKAADVSDIVRRYRANGGDLAPGDLVDASCTRSSVDVGAKAVVFSGIDFYVSAKEAADDFEIFSKGKPKVSGLGVPTILDDQGPQKVLKFRKGPYLVEVGITWLQSRGGRSVYAQTPKELMPLAKKVVNNVP